MGQAWFSAAVVALACLAGCGDDKRKKAAMDPALMPNDGVAVAHLMPSEKSRNDPKWASLQGDIKFIQHGSETRIYGAVMGLPPNMSFGFHVHANGDLSDPELKSAGPHWDPAAKHHHGAPGGMTNEAGDLGNITSDMTGTARIDVTTHEFVVVGDPSVVGHSLILHGGTDDLTSQPAGNSGPRVAGAVIFKK